MFSSEARFADAHGNAIISVECSTKSENIVQVMALTILIPVCVGDVTGRAFAGSNTLGVEDAVDINVVVMGGHSKVLASICKNGGKTCQCYAKLPNWVFVLFVKLHAFHFTSNSLATRPFSEIH